MPRLPITTSVVQLATRRPGVKMIVEALLITGATMIGLFYVYLLFGGLFGGVVEHYDEDEWGHRI